MEIALVKGRFGELLTYTNMVLHSDPELEKEESALRYWVKGNLHRMNGRPEEAEKILTQGLQNLPDIDSYGAELLTRFHLAAVQQGNNELANAKHNLELALQAPSRVPEFVPLAYLRLAQIAKAERRETRFHQLLRAGRLRQ